MAAIAASMSAVLAAPAGALGLTTYQATTSTRNQAGQLVATAKCGPKEHVISGGYKTSDATLLDGAVVSRAVRSDGWTVHFFASTPDTLTTYAYCERTGRLDR